MPKTMTKPRPGAHRLFAILIAGVSINLTACYDLTRFKQERYECGLNPDGLVEVDLRDFKIGGEATAIFSDRTVTMVITESSDSIFTLAQGKSKIRIDRNSGIIRMTKGARYRNIRCEKTEFRM